MLNENKMITFMRRIVPDGIINHFSRSMKVIDGVKYLLNNDTWIITIDDTYTFTIIDKINNKEYKIEYFERHFMTDTGALNLNEMKKLAYPLSVWYNFGFSTNFNENNFIDKFLYREYKLKYNKKTNKYDCSESLRIRNHYGNPIYNNTMFIEDGKFIISFGHINGSFQYSGCKLLKSLVGCPETINGSFSCSGCSSLTSLEGCTTKNVTHFSCGSCTSLLSLKGCPDELVEGFNCCWCTSLTSLKYCPKVIGGYMSCAGCKSLLSLEGCPSEINGDFVCSDCPSLTSLKGCPKFVNGYFNCRACTSLTSLNESPTEVSRNFYCTHCISLTSLDGITQHVGGIIDSDFN